VRGQVSPAAARTTLEGPAPNATAYNNAALSYERGYDCSGDPKALQDAEAALEARVSRHARGTRS